MFGFLKNIRNNNKKKIEPDSYVYCKVVFEQGGNEYHYRIRNDERFKYSKKDVVLVPVRSIYKFTIATIVDIKTYNKDNVPYPLESTRLVYDLFDEKKTMA